MGLEVCSAPDRRLELKAGNAGTRAEFTVEFPAAARGNESFSYRNV